MIDLPQPLRPPRLEPGMTLGIVAPSGPVRERSQLMRGVARLEQMGFRIELGAHVFDSYGYLAGGDADRAADLVEMLERPDVDAVMCARGGYGAARAVRALDLDRLRALRGRPAKPFIGYSDITVLHALLRKELGWISFYGPMGTTFANPTDYTVAAFEQGVMRAEPFTVAPDPDDPYVATINGGTARGPLVGGCLALVVALLGTPWELDLRGGVFFFEDVNEQPYGIDRMLTQLVMAGKLQACAGIVIGEHADCEPRGPSNSLGLEQVFDDVLKPLGLPTIYHLPIGHGRHHATLPIGALVELDADQRQLRVLEPGVV